MSAYTWRCPVVDYAADPRPKQCEGTTYTLLSSRWAGPVGTGPGGRVRAFDPGSYLLEYVQCTTCGEKSHRRTE